MPTKLHYYYFLIKNTVKQKYCEILLQLKEIVSYILSNVIYSCDAKLNVQYHYSSLQYHVILQKSFLNADLLLEKHFLLLLMLNTVVMLNMYLKNVVHFFQYTFMNIVFKSI